MSILVGEHAPDFTEKAVMEDNEINNHFHLMEYLSGNYGILFFYPLDFTFVCPSELIAFNNKFEEFKKRKAKLIAVSIDSHFVHLAWKKTAVENGGIGNINYPMIADINKNVARAYGVLNKDGIAFRGLFLIDKNGIVRHQLVNDLPLGRSVEEAIRMLDALIYVEEHGEVCPANWKKGKNAIKPTAEGIASYLASNSSNI